MAMTHIKLHTQIDPKSLFHHNSFDFEAATSNLNWPLFLIGNLGDFLLKFLTKIPISICLSLFMTSKDRKMIQSKKEFWKLFIFFNNMFVFSYAKNLQ